MDYQSLLTKYNDELQVEVELPPLPPHLKPYDPIWNTPITYKKNFVDWMRGGKPVFCPMPTHNRDIAPYCVPDVVARHFVTEMTPESPDNMGGKDMFGVEWQYIPGADGSMVIPGKPAVEDIEDWRDGIVLPDVDSWPWEEDAKLNECLKNDYFSSKCWFFTGYFERLISWMDFEEAAVAMIDPDCEDALHEALDACCDTYEKVITNLKKYFDISTLYFHDDWGSQLQPFFSLEAGMRILEPHLKRMVDFAHSLDIAYEMHCCGHSEALVPIMIAAGADTWRGQEMNSYDDLFDNYGDQIRVQVRINAPDQSLSEQEVFDQCMAFLDRYSADNKWAAPHFTKKPTTHPMFYPIMYAASREYYATH